MYVIFSGWSVGKPMWAAAPLLELKPPSSGTLINFILTGPIKDSAAWVSRFFKAFESKLLDILLLPPHTTRAKTGYTAQVLQHKRADTEDYPLAQNQYINNSPGVFTCIRAGANTGATCICTEMNSLKNLANMRKMIPQKYFPVFA